MNTRFLLSGGPGAGKTTVLRELARRGFLIRPEAGRGIIRHEAATDGDALPWKDANAYARKMLEVSITDYTGSDPALVTFFDRGIPDVVGYTRLIGQKKDPEQEERLRADFPYHPSVFLFPVWEEIYVNDAERKQDLDESVRTCETIRALFREWGYTCVDVPKTGVSERVDFLLGYLSRLGLATDTGFSVLFYLENDRFSIIEIKRHHPKSSEKKDTYQWLLFDQKNGALLPLSFVSMENSPEEQMRVFEQGTLRFGAKTGSWKGAPEVQPLVIPEIPTLSPSLWRAVQAFLLT